ncbi:putative two-component system sensor kinase [Actinacidiphila reveromycinica]|uniref:histidine kinase n=1 Tax=Actinacidiphila reveromycinica TaxID=659352 RepID=A0A7U3UZT0_9ACTN|nr:putative two-component system sensor kinase [Streptomyces sp. SN-593]
MTAWLTAENHLLQLFSTATGIAVCAVLVHPRGASGTGLAVLCLLVLNSLLLCTRLIPEGTLSPRSQTAVLGAGSVAAAALMSMDRSGSASLFAFFVAGHAGYRLGQRAAVILAAATSLLCATVLLFPVGSGYGHVSWYLGALTGVSVLVGISNRSHADALRSARDAARQAELASRSEARAEALAERARIARDVHDVLAHSLAGVNMQLEVTDALLESGAVDEARQAAQRAQSLVRAGLTEVQRTVRDLREDALPLLDTLRAMLGSIPGTGTLSVDGSPRELPVRPAQVIVRCAQEGLTNAHKYAPGAPVRLHLAYGPDETAFEVVNSAPPAGSRPLAGAGGGMGLVGMRERVELVGGTVTAGPVVDGDDAGGWRVRVVIPV